MIDVIYIEDDENFLSLFARRVEGRLNVTQVFVKPDKPGGLYNLSTAIEAIKNNRDKIVLLDSLGLGWIKIVSSVSEEDRERIVIYTNAANEDLDAILLKAKELHVTVCDEKKPDDGIEPIIQLVEQLHTKLFQTGEGKLSVN